MYAERMPPDTPNCDELCPVEARVLLEENRDAVKIYQIVRGQVVTAGEAHEIIDLNYQAVKVVMDLYNVKDQRRVFENVCTVFHHFLAKEREERK